MAALLMMSVAANAQDEVGNITPDHSAGMGMAKVPAPTMRDANGNEFRVTGVGPFQYLYDGSGALSSIVVGVYSCDTQGNRFTMILEDGKLIYTITRCEDGFITKIHTVSNVSYSDGSYNNSDVTTSYSYNSSHQLSECSATWSESMYEKSYEESFSATGTYQFNYTWEDGNLVQVFFENRVSGEENGESFTAVGTCTHTFQYGSQVNTSKQFPYFMGESGILGDDLGFLSAAGLFGYGPANLPSEHTEVWDDGYEQETYGDTFSYALNDNGTIRTETYGGSNVNYQYEMSNGIRPSMADVTFGIKTYDLLGRRMAAPRKGVSVVKTENGVTKKVLVK